MDNRILVEEKNIFSRKFPREDINGYINKIILKCSSDFFILYFSREIQIVMNQIECPINKISGSAMVPDSTFLFPFLTGNAVLFGHYPSHRRKFVRAIAW